MSAKRAIKIGVVVLVVGALVGAYEIGLLARFAEPKTLGADIVDLGAWGYVAFVIAYISLQPFGVPGMIFVVAAPLIWPWPIAFAVSMIGTMGASVVGFSFARFVAKDWISARIPVRFHKYSDALERNAFQTIVILRLVFWMPQVLHFFFGVSKVKFSTHFWGSLVGYVPPLLAVSYFGTKMFDASGTLQPGAWRIFVAMIVVSLLVVLGIRAYNRRTSPP
jgi:uncharacterized membrane protein YdjX (TVP38/TMEM64 family)